MRVRRDTTAGCLPVDHVPSPPNPNAMTPYSGQDSNFDTTVSIDAAMFVFVIQDR